MKHILFSAILFTTINTLFVPTGYSISKKAIKTNIKYMGDAIAFASKEELKDLNKLMKLMPSTAPSHIDKKTGEQVFKITNIVKGSPFEKAGFKVGDLVMNGNSPQ